MGASYLGHDLKKDFDKVESISALKYCTIFYHITLYCNCSLIFLFCPLKILFSLFQCSVWEHLGHDLKKDIDKVENISVLKYCIILFSIIYYIAIVH